MSGRSVYSLHPSFVYLYKQGRTQFDLTPAHAVDFAVRELEKREAKAGSPFDSIRSTHPGDDRLSDCQEALNPADMEADNGLDDAPLPSRRSRKSVNWAPQFISPSPEKTGTFKRSNSRSSSPGFASSPPGNFSALLQKMSNPKTHATEDAEEDSVEVHVVNSETHVTEDAEEDSVEVHVVSYGKGKTEQEKKFDSNLPTVPKNDPDVNSASRILRKRPLASPIVSKKGPKHKYQVKKQRKQWVSVPLDKMEIPVETSVDNADRNYRQASPEVKETYARSSKVEVEKGGGDQNVAISNVSKVLQESTKFLKEKGRGESNDETLPELQKAITGVKGFICEVEHMVQSLREEMVQKIRAEKAECELNAAAERQKLRDEIARLKQINRTVVAEKVRFQKERNKLQKDYLGTLEKAESSLRLQLDKTNAQAEANAVHLSNELAKEQDKSFCQICYTAPRDAIVLPCMHFHYCNECLQKHQQRSKDCPTCRAKINGVLRCNISTT